MGKVVRLFEVPLRSVMIIVKLREGLEIFRMEHLQGTTKNRTVSPYVGRPLSMRKSVVERVCMGQQAFPGKGVAIFHGS